MIYFKHVNILKNMNNIEKCFKQKSYNISYIDMTYGLYLFDLEII